MDVRELRYFLAVARCGSFSRAAQQLNITQPALSRQLKKLEEELGVTLFIRSHQGVELTESGALLMPQAESHIFQLQETVTMLRGQREQFIGQVLLGLAPTSGLLLAPRLLERFRARWPIAALVLREGISSSLQEWLLDRRLDIAVLHNPPPLDGIMLWPVITERMVLVQSPSAASTFKWGNSITISELERLPLVLPSLPHSNRRLIEQAASQHGVSLNVLNEVDSVPLLRSLVKQGFGSTIMTYAGVAQDVERGELVAVPIDRPPLMSTVSIAMPREARSNWLVLETARMLRGVIAEVVKRGEWPGARIASEGDTVEFS